MRNLKDRVDQIRSDHQAGHRITFIEVAALVKYIAELEDAIEGNTNFISAQNETIASLEEKVTSYKDELSNYDV